VGPRFEPCRNLDIKTCKHEGGFCGHFSRVVVSDFRSLRGDIVSEALSARQSPGGKNPVPGGRLEECDSDYREGASKPCSGSQSGVDPVRPDTRLVCLMQCTPAASDSPSGNAGVQSCTTRFENAHRTVRREVLYRFHPWAGQAVFVHAVIDRADGGFFRCTLDGSGARRWLEIPSWMFDRASCARGHALTTEPCVSLEALSSLSALLDLAVKTAAASPSAEGGTDDAGQLIDAADAGTCARHCRDSKGGGQS
jgi:hypothetical protein